MAEHAQEFQTRYGNVSAASIGAIQRGLLALEQGADRFVGEPMLNIDDLLQTAGTRGVVNILAADKLLAAPTLYSTLLLWLLSELYERLPEVGDPEKPKLVFFSMKHICCSPTRPTDQRPADLYDRRPAPQLNRDLLRRGDRTRHLDRNECAALNRRPRSRRHHRLDRLRPLFLCHHPTPQQIRVQSVRQGDRSDRYARFAAGRHHLRPELRTVLAPTPPTALVIRSVHVSPKNLSGHDSPCASYV